VKGKENTMKKLMSGPKSDLLSLVAAKLKGRDLFPKKTEEAKKYLSQAKFKVS
jgi:hypothetical protein